MATVSLIIASLLGGPSLVDPAGSTASRVAVGEQCAYGIEVRTTQDDTHPTVATMLPSPGHRERGRG